MKKNYIRPVARFVAMAAAENYLTTSIPVTDENVDDSGKAKGNFFDDEESLSSLQMGVGGRPAGSVWDY